MKNQGIILKLILFVLIIFLIKIWIGSYFYGPQVIPDESCVIVKAKALINEGRLVNCNDLFDRNTGDPFPLYSIVIAPLYLLFQGTAFYKAILIFNALLVVSLIFPIKKILEKISKEKINTLPVIFITLFTTQISIFEKTAMTETLFTVINIWALYFYLKSFYTHKILNKSLAIIFLILAALTRPFGFVGLIALVLNEFILAKNKKLLAIISLITIAVITFSINFFLPSIIPVLWATILTLGSHQNIIQLVQALVNQVNSLTFATYFIPLVVFVYYFLKEKNPLFKKIRYYLLFLILGIFLISLRHLYGYFIEVLPSGLSTRYINLPIILIILFGLHFLDKKEEFTLTGTAITTIGLLVLSLIFTSQSDYSSGINLDYYNHFFAAKIIGSFFIIIFILTTALILKKKQAIILCTTILIFTQSAYMLTGFSKSSNLAYRDNEVIQYFYNKSKENNNYKILYLSRGEKFTESFWGLISTTDHTIDLVYFDYEKKDKANIIDQQNKSLTVKVFTGTIQDRNKKKVQDIDAADYDYMITTAEIPGLKLATSNINSEFVYELVKDND